VKIMVDEKKLTAEDYLNKYIDLQEQGVTEAQARGMVAQAILDDEDMRARAIAETAHVFDKYTEVLGEEASDRTREQLFKLSPVAFEETLTLMAAEDYAAESIIKEGQIRKLDGKKRVGIDANKLAERAKGDMKATLVNYGDDVGDFVDETTQSAAKLLSNRVGTDYGETKFSDHLRQYVGTKEAPGMGLKMLALAEETKKLALPYAHKPVPKATAEVEA